MEFQEKYSSVFKHYALPLVLGLVGLISLGYGLIASNTKNQQKDEILFESSKDTKTEASEKINQVTVDVEGAVIKPGVYKLPSDARIQDGLVAAGGMSDEADRERVAKTMNLAGKLIDGAKIYIPIVGDTTNVSIENSTQIVAGDSTTALINVNSASASELDTLSGVGPATAAKIISNRPYEKIEDLVTKKAVGQSVFEKIKANISVF